jgi:hypothetical protein
MKHTINQSLVKNDYKFTKPGALTLSISQQQERSELMRNNHNRTT